MNWWRNMSPAWRAHVSIVHYFLLGGGKGTWFGPVRLVSYSSLHHTRIHELLGSLCAVVQDSHGPMEHLAISWYMEDQMHGATDYPPIPPLIISFVQFSNHERHSLSCVSFPPTSFVDHTERSDSSQRVMLRPPLEFAPTLHVLGEVGLSY